MLSILLVVLLSLTTLRASQAVPINFGPGGIYSCKCKDSDRVPSNCNQNTGECTGTQTCVNGAQYGRADMLGNCQIENIALGKPTTQTTPLNPAAWAVDGLPFEQFSDGSCSSTGNNLNLCLSSVSPGSWWQVDLEKARNISAVWLLNRIDHPERLANIVVKVWDDNTLNWQTCYDFTAAAGLWTRRLCSQPLQGRYVRVEKTQCASTSSGMNSEVSLCEVLVIDKIYIAASVSHLTASNIRVNVNTSQYTEQFVYRTTLTPSGAHGCSRTVQPPPVIKKTGNIIDFNQLQPLWDYEIRIQPEWNSRDYGPPTTFTFTTLGDIPSGPPTNIKVVQITSTNATVQWDALPCEHWRGLTRVYELHEIGTSSTWRNTTSTSLSLVGLQPYTPHTVYVRSTNENGHSNSDSFSFQTAAGRPTQPQNVSVVSYTERSIEVRWTAPVRYNGPPGIYIVSYKVISSSFSRTENTTNTQIVLQGLPSGEIFEVLVYASTIGAGVGPASAPVKQHTKPPIPTTFNIAWTSADLKITVHLPPAGQNRYLKGYLILVDAAASTNRTRRSLNTYCTNASSSAYISANITNIPHSGLLFTVGDNVISGGVWNRPLSAMNYTIYVIAVNGFESDESYRCISEEVTVSALQSAPSDSGVSGSKTGAIAGGSVSTVVALSAVAAVVVLIIRRRWRKPEMNETSMNETSIDNKGYDNMNPGTNDVGSTDEMHIYMQIENPTEPDSGIKTSEFKKHIGENKAMSGFKEKFENSVEAISKAAMLDNNEYETPIKN